MEVDPVSNENSTTKSCDYRTTMENLETQELESAGGVASAQVYVHLLALYLHANDTCNAKFLWKRIPQSVKTATPELSQLWTVGQNLWQRDFPALYEALNKNWSESIKQILQEMTEKVRLRAFNLVAQAYSSINIDEYLQFVGLPHQEALDAAVEKGWQIDKDTNMILPVKPVIKEDMSLLNDQQLSVLTDYVSFLEN